MAIGFFLTITSIFIGLNRFKRQHDWQRRKAAEEILSRLVEGEFPNILDSIILNFNWDIVNGNHSYSQIAAEISDDKRKELHNSLRRLLRTLETVCIQIKHKVVDNEICKDYLASIMPKICNNCRTFIILEQATREDDRVFENLLHYSAKYEQTATKYKNSNYKDPSIKPKKHTG